MHTGTFEEPAPKSHHRAITELAMVGNLAGSEAIARWDMTPVSGDSGA
jgi:hypothetical protein